MIEVTIRNYLLDELNNVPVLFEQPKSKTNTYVIIHELDRGKTNQISANTFEFIIGAPTYYNARVLCGQVRGLLETIDDPSISSAKIGGERGGYNTTTNNYEYNLIFNFIHYEED